MSSRKIDVENLAKIIGNFVGCIEPIAALPDVARRFVELMNKLFPTIEHDRFSLNDPCADIGPSLRSKIFRRRRIHCVAVFLKITSFWVPHTVTSFPYLLS